MTSREETRIHPPRAMLGRMHAVSTYRQSWAPPETLEFKAFVKNTFININSVDNEVDTSDDDASSCPARLESRSEWEFFPEESDEDNATPPGPAPEAEANMELQARLRPDLSQNCDETEKGKETNFESRCQRLDTPEGTGTLSPSDVASVEWHTEPSPWLQVHQHDGQAFALEVMPSGSPVLMKLVEGNKGDAFVIAKASDLKQAGTTPDGLLQLARACAPKKGGDLVKEVFNRIVKTEFRRHLQDDLSNIDMRKSSGCSSRGSEESTYAPSEQLSQLSLSELGSWEMSSRSASWIQFVQPQMAQPVPSVASMAQPMRIFMILHKNWYWDHDELLGRCPDLWALTDRGMENGRPWRVMGVKVFAHQWNYAQVRQCVEQHEREKELRFNLSLAEIDDLKFDHVPEHGLQITEIGKAITNFNSRFMNKTEKLFKRDTIVEIDGLRISLLSFEQIECVLQKCRAQRQEVAVAIRRKKPHVVFVTEDLLPTVRKVLRRAGALENECVDVTWSTTSYSSASYPWQAQLTRAPFRPYPNRRRVPQPLRLHPNHRQAPQPLRRGCCWGAGVQ